MVSAARPKYERLILVELDRLIGQKRGQIIDFSWSSRPIETRTLIQTTNLHRNQTPKVTNSGVDWGFQWKHFKSSRAVQWDPKLSLEFAVDPLYMRTWLLRTPVSRLPLSLLTSSCAEMLTLRLPDEDCEVCSDDGGLKEKRTKKRKTRGEDLVRQLSQSDPFGSGCSQTCILLILRRSKATKLLWSAHNDLNSVYILMTRTVLCGAEHCLRCLQEQPLCLVLNPYIAKFNELRRTSQKTPVQSLTPLFHIL